MRFNSSSKANNNNIETMLMKGKTKKLRSELPRRRRRTQISPVLLNLNSLASIEKEINLNKKTKKVDDTGACRGGGLARTASFSESSSCVDSNSGRADYEKLRLNKSKSRSVNEASSEVAVTKSEISSCVEQGPSVVRNLTVSSNTKGNEVVSLDLSAVESCFPEELARETTSCFDCVKSRAFEFNETLNSVSKSESTIEQKPQDYENSCFDSDNLECTEQYDLSYEYVFSSSQATQDFSESEIELLDYYYSDLEDLSSEYFTDSQRDFSERSVGDNSAPSLTFSLLIQYRNEFLRSSSVLDIEITSDLKEEHKDQSTFVTFEDEEDEESYKLLRNRERRQVFLHNNAYNTSTFFSTKDCRDLVLQQRSSMIDWIVERSSKMKLQPETMFLGVSLLNRFLCKGFFHTERNLQIVAVACLTLATRMEENQPYNGVRQKNFHVESNVYTKGEVVAMEWLVQEVLNFQCFLPTIYNFLWFYLKAARANKELENRARRLAVLQLSDHVHLSYWPSTVAASIVIVAALKDNLDESRQRVIETHIRTKGDDLYQCIESLEWMLMYI